MPQPFVSVQFGLLGEGRGAEIASVPNAAVDLRLVPLKIGFGFELLLARVAGKTKPLVMNGSMSAQEASAGEGFSWR